MKVHVQIEALEEQLLESDGSVARAQDGKDAMSFCVEDAEY